MKKTTDFVSFLFLSSLIVFTGFFFMAANIGFALTTDDNAGEPFKEPPAVNNELRSPSNNFISNADPYANTPLKEALSWKSWDQAMPNTVEYKTNLYRGVGCNDASIIQAGNWEKGSEADSSSTTKESLIVDLPDEDYYSWKTKSRYIGFINESGYSTCFNFGIRYDPNESVPEPPELYRWPANGAMLDIDDVELNPTTVSLPLSWIESDDFAIKPTYYNLGIWEGSSCSGTYLQDNDVFLRYSSGDQTPPKRQYLTGFEPDATYSWKVRARYKVGVDASGNPIFSDMISPYTECYSFTIEDISTDTTIDQPPTVSNIGRKPFNGGTQDESHGYENYRMTIVWGDWDSNPDTVDQYQANFYKGNDCTGTLVYPGQWGDYSSISNTKTLSYDFGGPGIYSWHVRGRYVDLDTPAIPISPASDFSDCWYFTFEDQDDTAYEPVEDSIDDSVKDPVDPVEDSVDDSVKDPVDPVEDSVDDSANLYKIPADISGNDMGTMIVIKKRDTQSFEVMSTPPNTALNAWHVIMAPGSTISKSGVAASYSDIRPNYIIRVFGERDSINQRIYALSVAIRKPVTTTDSTRTLPTVDDGTGNLPVTDTWPGPTEQSGGSATQPYPLPDGPYDDLALQTARIQKYCLNFGILDSVQCQKFVELDLDPLCKSNKIFTASECDTFLKKRLLDRECLSAGVTTPEACNDFLLKKYRSELYCGVTSQEECLDVTKNQLLGHVTKAANRSNIVERVMKRTVEEEKVTHITTQQLVDSFEAEELEENEDAVTEEVLPLARTNTKPLLIIKSNKVIDVSSQVTAKATVSYITTIDTDQDGLSNDLEEIYGTDPNNPDTDGDGFTDLEELKNGYSPLIVGGSLVARKLTPVESAMVNAREIDQPITSGIVTDNFETKAATPTGDKSGIILTGKGRPNSVILVYIYSQMPLVLAVETDGAGNWNYTLTDTLADGKHTVYVAITDDTGKIQEKSNPLAFFVEEAQAVTITSFLEDEAIQGGISPEEQYTKYYLYGAVGIILLSLIGVLILLRAKQKSNYA